MGAWGTGTFENDAAADFLWEYEDAGVEAVERAFEMVLSGHSSGYIDSDAGSWGLAAGEIVAASHGRPSAMLDPETLNSVKVHEIDVKGLSQGRKRAAEVVSAVSTAGGASELYELWNEGDLLADWLAGVDDLKARLMEGGG